MPAGLIALALGGFGIGLTEFVIMGLLPEIATDFGVSEAAAGWFITGYALSVVVGALLVTAAVTRLPRKPVLIGLLVLFIAGNFLSAIADSYQAMLIGRIVAALCHGAFFGIGSVVAAGLVPAHKKAGAIAIMFTGLTAANVLGVPFGTFLGQNLGWRSTFWAITIIGVVALIGIALMVPRTKEGAVASSLRSELGAFKSGQVWLSIIVTILGFGGMFGAFTYIAFTLTDVSGFDPHAVPWLLVLFGAGLFVGNIAGGKAADKSIDNTLVVILAGLVLVLVFFATHRREPGGHPVLAGTHGRLRLRYRSGPADARHALCRHRTHPRLRREYRRLQPGQRPRRLAGRRHHHHGPGLHLADLGRCRHHRSGPARHDRRRGGGPARGSGAVRFRTASSPRRRTRT